MVTPAPNNTRYDTFTLNDHSELTADYMGRRVYKKVETVTPAAPDTENGEDSDTPTETRTILTNHRFLYRGYLQIAALNLGRSTLNDLWLITWDPTESVATRPLAIQQSGTWYIYGTDLPKNVTELYSTSGYIHTTYTYSPYGLVTASGNVTQPLQWSSEYADTDLGLVYYNYRHYNPLDGRWTGRDPQDDFYPLFLYDYCFNNPVNYIDIKGESGLCQDYLWFGGTCINNSSHDEYALYDSEWYLLKPGQSTPYNKDCDGMTCGGKYYAVKGIIAFASNTATCDDSGLETGSAIVEWDGKDNSSENRHSPVGSGASDLPPNMK